MAMMIGAELQDGKMLFRVVRPCIDFRLCADSDGGIVNAMIQGSVLSMCRSADKVLGVLGMLRLGIASA